MNKKFFLKLFLGLSGGVFILLLFLPLIVRKVVVNNSKEWTGRSISWEKFKVNYVTGTISLMDVKLYEPDDTSVFVGFDTLIIDTEPYRYFKSELVIEQLYLAGLRTNVVMYDSAFNFDDLLALAAPDTSQTKEVTLESEPLTLEFSNLELKDAFLSIRDHSIDKTMELSNFNFFVPYISLNQEEKSNAGLRFDFKNGGYFESNIDVNPSQGDFEVEISMKELDITGYTDFVRKYMNVGAFQGLANFALQLNGNLYQPERTSASGIVSLIDFELDDHKDQKLFGVEKLRVNLKEVDPSKSRFVIDSLLIQKPYGIFELYDSTNNIEAYLQKVMPVKTQADSSVITSDSVEADLFYAVNAVIVEEGEIDIVDNRTGEPFKYNLSKVHVDLDSVSSASDWVGLHSDMLLNKRGKLLAEVGFNPSTPLDLVIDYTITDFILSDLNIYSRHYLGFPILYGDMYYKAHTEIIDGQISSDNKLIIHNVELGSKGRGLYDLPLKFALFLLKDKDGVITLDVPVSGDLKDPEVSVRKIVWNTFKNLIIKAAASPVKLLSGLIGADPSDIEEITYDYTDSTFTEQKKKQLDLLLQLEQQKPDLEIELVYFNDHDQERQQFAFNYVSQLYEKEERRSSYQEDIDQFEAYVRAKVNKDSISIGQACLQIVDSIRLDSLVSAYDLRRRSDVQQYLQRQSDTTEIQVIYFKASTPKNLGSRPKFEVKYGMKEEYLKID